MPAESGCAGPPGRPADLVAAGPSADRRLALVDEPGRLAMSRRADAAMRLLAELALTPPPGVRPADWLASRQRLSRRMLEPVLLDLSRAGLVVGLRGNTGGYRLAVDPGELTLADVIVAVDRPLAEACGLTGRRAPRHAAGDPLERVWVALADTVRQVLTEVTVAGIAPRSRATG